MNDMHLVRTIIRIPRLTYTIGDKARVNFILTIDGYNGSAQHVPPTAFGQLAETIHKHTDKGHLAALEGLITSDKYTNDQGETVYSLDAIAGTCQFLSRLIAGTTTPEKVGRDTEFPPKAMLPEPTRRSIPVHNPMVRDFHGNRSPS
jgi:single-stranded DNA-binding protein